MIDAALRAWRFNADRIDAFFNALSQDQLEQEIAPGRNRLIYLWGHIAAVNDGLFPLLGLGPKLYPEMEAMFIANPDRAAVTIYSAEQVKGAWSHVNEELFAGLSGWSPMEWLERHTAVSVDDFSPGASSQPLYGGPKQEYAYGLSLRSGDSHETEGEKILTEGY